MANNATHAAGQMLGYLRQIQQMFCELISQEDVTVSVEALDDVAVQDDDGSVTAQQLKSVSTGSNPITDRSPVLWKTLYNWLQYVLHDNFQINKTVFRLIVISEKEITGGSVVADFNAAQTVNKARDALLNAQRKIWGEKLEHRENIPDSYSEYLEAIFDKQHIDIIGEIISKMTVVVFAGDYDEQSKKKFNAIPLLYPDVADDLYTYMRGWVEKKVIDQCKTGKPAYIHSYEFYAVLREQQRAYNQRYLFRPRSLPIGKDVAKDAIEKQNPETYIRQLELIDAEFDEKCQAVVDYLRTKEETAIRADDGSFIPQCMDDYRDKLKRSWKYARTRVNNSKRTDIEKGTLLFSETSEAALSVRLQDSDLPSFFGCGSLHALANEPKEEPEIGWHPQYVTLLKGNSKNE